MHDTVLIQLATKKCDLDKMFFLINFEPPCLDLRNVAYILTHTDNVQSSHNMYI